MLWISAQNIQTRLDALTATLQGAQQFALVFTAFLSTGIGGILIAWHRVRQAIKGVEEKVDPVKHEVSDSVPDTLRQKVEEIATAMSSEKELRETQHEANSDRLDNMTTDLAATRKDVQEIHAIVQRLLVKLAGV